MSDLCKYRDILGKPKMGVHAYRFMNLAYVDLVMTIFGAYVLSRTYKRLSWLGWFFILLIMGVILHYIFCVNTTINVIIFGVR